MSEIFSSGTINSNITNKNIELCCTSSVDIELCCTPPINIDGVYICCTPSIHVHLCCTSPVDTRMCGTSSVPLFTFISVIHPLLTYFTYTHIYIRDTSSVDIYLWYIICWHISLKHSLLNDLFKHFVGDSIPCTFIPQWFCQYFSLKGFINNSFLPLSNSFGNNFSKSYFCKKKNLLGFLLIELEFTPNLLIFSVFYANLIEITFNHLELYWK